jgi:ribose transport system permease protein
LRSSLAPLLTGTASRAVALLVLVFVWLALFQPDVLAAPELILSRTAVVGIIALALTLVIIQGELDLSVGSVAAAAGGVLVIAPGPLPVQIILAIGFGILVGIVNGLMVTWLGLNSFIATLGTMIAVRGLALMFTGNKSTVLPEAEPAIKFTAYEILGQSVKTWIFVVMVVAVAIFLARTRIGRDFFAVGGNAEAARAVGINVEARKLLAFVMAGGVAALAGVLDAMSLGSADPTAGETALLNGVSAAVIGGALLTGGRGSALGTAIGAIAMAALAVGLGFAGADPSVQGIVTGIVLLIAIVSDRTLITNVTRAVRRRRASMRPARPVEREQKVGV